MSDVPDPDRFGPFVGGTASKRSSCELPRPHVDWAGVSDQGTASSSSTSSEDVSERYFHEYFDFDRFEHDQFQRDRETDATSQSDVPSEGTPPSSPPAGTAATPSADGEDHPMTDVPPPESQPSHVWPRVSKHPLPRDSDIQLETYPSPPPSPSTEMHAEPQSQAISSPNKKRTRRVKDTEETGDVRSMGACYCCKMSKTRCGRSEICEACMKKPFPALVCIRVPLQKIPSSRMVRWNWNDPNFMPSREQFDIGREATFSISCSESIDSPCLELKACPFLLSNQADRQVHKEPSWGIASNFRLLESEILRWMRQQIAVEKATGFEAEMDRLLLGFVLQLETSMQSKWQALRPLLLNLLNLRCMWKVWSCKQLFIRDPLEPRNGLVPFGLRYAAIQDSVRLLAAQAISELERKILPEIQQLMSKGHTDEANVVNWLLLWQMILVYRQSLGWIMMQEQPLSLSVMPMSPRRHEFRENTVALFKAVVVIYSGLFQKNTTVEKVRSAEPEIFGNELLYRVYQNAWRVLPDFYQQVLRQVSPTDELFKECIVKKETEILARSRPAQK